MKLYNGTDNTGTVLDDSDSESRSYSGSRVKTMFAEYPTGPDKSALNEAITAAETLYNSIKEVEDYSTIASTLKAAIDAAKDVAESDEADQDAVDAATPGMLLHCWKLLMPLKRYKNRRGNLNHNLPRRKDDFLIFNFSKKVLIWQENFKKGVNNVEVFATSRVGTTVTTKKSW